MSEQVVRIDGVVSVVDTGNTAEVRVEGAQVVSYQYTPGRIDTYYAAMACGIGFLEGWIARGKS